MNEQKRIFITGTDTDVGKTFFSAALIMALQKSQYSVLAFKPVAAGCEWFDGELKNQDALTLIDAMAVEMDYQTVNPIALEKPIAPHLSAIEDGTTLSVDIIRQSCLLNQYSSSYILVEGAGGWLVPLNDNETFADYVKSESLDVILVVGLKLGCINHALLSQQSIIAKGLNLVGWVANHIDPQMLQQQENIETLKQALNCPLIAQIPYITSDKPINQASKYVSIAAINSSVIDINCEE